MPEVALVPFLQGLSAVGFAVTAARLYSAGLARRYRALFLYSVFNVPVFGSGAFLRTDSPAFFYLYLIAEPMGWVLSAWLVIELYGLVLERHQGLFTVGRRAMYAILGAAILVSMLTLLPHITPEMPQASRMIGYYTAVARGLNCALAVFLLLMLVFLSLFAVSPNRNVLIHSVVYTGFFLSNTLGNILHTVFGLKYAVTLNAVLVASSCACTFAWCILLTRRGEAVRVVQPWFGPDQEERILGHLDALNATLLKSAKIR